MFQGMSLIESKDVEGFHGYLAEHANTICGRHPIAVRFCFVLRVCRTAYLQ